MGDETRITSGRLIRTARRKMGLSQIEVAGLADVSRRTVQNAESGTASVKLSSLRAIGEVVHVYLYDDADDAIDSEALVSNVASFGYLPFRMFKFVGSRIKPSELAFCYDEQEFLSELEILWQNFERGLASFCPIKASRFVEVHPKFCRKQGYMERYLGIWRANPKAFSFSETGGRRSGVSIVLPVAKSTYKEFLPDVGAALASPLTRSFAKVRRLSMSRSRRILINASDRTRLAERSPLPLSTIFRMCCLMYEPRLAISLPLALTKRTLNECGMLE